MPKGQHAKKSSIDGGVFLVNLIVVDFLCCEEGSVLGFLHGPRQNCLWEIQGNLLQKKVPQFCP